MRLCLNACVCVFFVSGFKVYIVRNRRLLFNSFSIGVSVSADGHSDYKRFRLVAFRFFHIAVISLAVVKVCHGPGWG